MRIDCVGTATLADVAAEGATLEAAGCDGLWIGEIRHDPLLQIALAGASTSAMQLGTGVAIALARSPMTLAYSAWDLQQLTHGRFVLGLGSQVKAHVERRFSMPWSKPVNQMREFVSATREIWDGWASGRKVAFTGEHYTHTLSAPMFVPEPAAYAPPPIFLAAVGEGMARLVGEVADGFIAHPFTSARYLREVIVPTISEGLKRAARDTQQVAICAKSFVACGADDSTIQRAAEKVRSQIAFYASTSAYLPVLDLHGWAGLQPQLHALSRAGSWEEMTTLVPDEVLAEFAVIGTPTDVAREIESRFGWADRLILIGDTAAPNLAEIVAAHRAQ